MLLFLGQVNLLVSLPGAALHMRCEVFGYKYVKHESWANLESKTGAKMAWLLQKICFHLIWKHHCLGLEAIR